MGGGSRRVRVRVRVGVGVPSKGPPCGNASQEAGKLEPSREKLKLLLAKAMGGSELSCDRKCDLVCTPSLENPKMHICISVEPARSLEKQ